MTADINPSIMRPIPWRMRRMGILVALALGLLAPTVAQQIPVLTALPPDTAASNPALAERRAALVQERAALHGKIDSLNARCDAVVEGSDADASCQGDQAELLSALKVHIQKSNDYNAAAESAKVASTSAAQPAPVQASERARIIKGINALARQLGWSADKLSQLNEALRRLAFDGDPDATPIQICQTWQIILARSHDASLMREASRGGGLGFPGSGTQTHFQDCTIFALANATGLPYGVVASRATELIRTGNWHSVDDRATPQLALEKRGLNGLEVVMLTEAFGQAEVVPIEDFARTLKAGRTVMVNVVPTNGNVRSGHEVVLTSTFQHNGETWFVIMDSNQGPVGRIFVRRDELNTVLQENGVAYRPEARTTPKLLRDEATP